MYVFVENGRTLMDFFFHFYHARIIYTIISILLLLLASRCNMLLPERQVQLFGTLGKYMSYVDADIFRRKPCKYCARHIIL